MDSAENIQPCVQNEFTEPSEADELEENEYEDISYVYDQEIKGSKKKEYKPKERLSCDQCEYTASLPHHLRRHQEYAHQGIRYPCADCDYVGSRPENLHSHRRSQHEDATYYCDECDYVTKAPANLKQHKQSRHEGRGLYHILVAGLLIDAGEKMKKKKMPWG